jgi:hypothetical protein
MTDQPSFGSLAGAAPWGVPDADLRFRIAVLGDFGGRGRGNALNDRRAVKVAYEEIDDVLARTAVEVRLSAGKSALAVPVASLDDFHPDQVFGNVDRFDDLSDEDEQGELMRTVLHHPHYQSVESAWRGLEWLLKRVSKVGRIEVVLYDVPRDEFAADLTRSDDLSQSGLFHLLIDKGTEGPKGSPWGALLGLYSFAATRADAELLGRMAKLAARAAAPFLAGADAAFLKSPAEQPTPDDQAWTALRALPEAAWLGLAWPRFLLRLPYGSDTQSIDRFSFEEFADRTARQPYLWGPAAYACGALLGQAFQKQGWALKPGAVLDLDAMPMHVGVDEDGDPMTTLAEFWLDRPKTDLLARRGIMALLSTRGRDALQLLRFQSLAQPPKDKPFVELCGRWNPAAAPAPVVAAAAEVKAALGMPPSQPAVTDVPPADPSAPVAPPAPAAEDQADAELAALLQELTASSQAEPEPTPTALPTEPQGPTSAETDASFREPTPPVPEAAAPAPPEPTSSDEADAELAALLAEIEGRPA